MRLLLVDGSNLIMRAAFGGELAPHIALANAVGLIRRAVEQAQASHLVVALDCPGTPGWRKLKYPAYKANRERDTSPWIHALYEECSRRNWWTAEAAGFEADDVIATLARRALGRAGVIICSGDSDLLPLVTDGAAILKPVNGGKFEAVTAADICARYHLGTPDLLRDLKALTGESGDNIPGVPGIGPVRAAKLLAEHGDLAGVISAADRSPVKDLLKVAQHRATVLLALELVSLRTDAPVLPITPKGCAYVD